MDNMTRRSRWAAIGLGIGLAVAGAVVALELAGSGWAAVGAATGVVTGSFAPSVYTAMKSRSARREDQRSLPRPSLLLGKSRQPDLGKAARPVKWPEEPTTRGWWALVQAVVRRAVTLRRCRRAGQRRCGGRWVGLHGRP
jgi:hypothetical protein